MHKKSPVNHMLFGPQQGNAVELKFRASSFPQAVARPFGSPITETGCRRYQTGAWQPADERFFSSTFLSFSISLTSFLSDFEELPPGSSFFGRSLPTSKSSENLL